MSQEEIMNVLKGERGDTSHFPKTETRESMDLEAMLSDRPIPGESLANSPDARLPFENPPEFTDVQEFIDSAFLQLTESTTLPDVLDVLRSQIPVETLAHKYLMASFQKGKISPDLMLSSIEPMIYLFIVLGTHANIDISLYPEEDMFTDEEQNSTTAQLFRDTARDIERVTDGPGKLSLEDVKAPEIMPKSLLERSKAAVDKVGGSQ